MPTSVVYNMLMAPENSPPEASDQPTKEAKQDAAVAVPGQAAVNEPAANFYHPENDAADMQHLDLPDAPHIEWASEESGRPERSIIWYFGAAAAVVVILVLAFFLTHDWITMIAAVVVAVLFFVSVTRSARAIEYSLDNHGITVGRRHYEYAAFKSFSLFEDGAVHSLLLTPMKRYLPPLSLNCPIDRVDQIAEILGSYLPFEMREPDSIERVARRLRF